ncbi:hypothetical protein [Stigmatella aurantiaca]|uniref:Uncharacterized protein n=1 Tax=Stigmatella aurantiaca (strain DW4/3-1) TaxID=378806 RepID=Q09B91_STIAD|nr:hypothetical protein [Stigmatella aurantiaca]ADO69151.1 uncharacterized protein STAUR_1347 [Stigmatella aurantiaca DW4/3-1]EAU68956.1 conserved hypothetical protein [Stigmatella aurantiaca DW4/3-1]
MKLRMMWVSWLTLAAACGGPVQDEESLSEQPSSLAQQAPGDESIAGGGPCGTNYCGKGTFCCNAGCGVCAPLGGGCPDVVCD